MAPWMGMSVCHSTGSPLRFRLQSLYIAWMSFNEILPRRLQIQIQRLKLHEVGDSLAAGIITQVKFFAFPVKYPLWVAATFWIKMHTSMRMQPKEFWLAPDFLSFCKWFDKLQGNTITSFHYLVAGFSRPCDHAIAKIHLARLHAVCACVQTIVVRHNQRPVKNYQQLHSSTDAALASGISEL